jgi:Zn-dependent peptidase ImmA (M78 family)
MGPWARRRRTKESVASERELRRRCRRLLRELDIQPPLDIRDFCARLAKLRGRPIKLVPYPIWADGPFGVWLKAERTDYIFYQRDTTESHQRHIILHEVGHLLADHPSDDEGGDLTEVLGLPDGQLPVIAGRARYRTSYDDQEEREAETIATIILEWAAVLDAAGIPPTSGPTEAVDAALSDRLGWL